MKTVPMADIKKFLIALDPVALGWEQFALDWIEETIERIDEILDSAEITTDDETFSGALHYRVENILQIMRTDARCYHFFVDLNQLLSE